MQGHSSCSKTWLTPKLALTFLMLFIILEIKSRFIYLIGGSIYCRRATLVESTDIHQRAMLMDGWNYKASKTKQTGSSPGLLRRISKEQHTSFGCRFTADLDEGHDFIQHLRGYFAARMFI